MVGSIQWWKAAGIRAIKTIAQTAIATIGSSAIISEVNWTVVLSASALAGLLSLLTSIAVNKVINENPKTIIPDVKFLSS